MLVEIVPFKSKTWGVIPLPDHEGHFHTGYEGQWAGGWGMNQERGEPKSHMMIGKNAVICDARFRFDSFGRGRSAANFYGHFEGSDVQYELGMSGVMDVLTGIQNGRLRVVDSGLPGYVRGDWTFAKQGQSIFLTPLI